MVIRLTMNGDRLMAVKLRALGDSVVHPFGAQIEMLEELTRIVDANFQSQGRRGGGSWKRDSRKWLRRKLALKLDPRIEHATGLLRMSLTKVGNEWMVFIPREDGFDYGSELPYARVQRLGWPARNIPARDYGKLMQSDVKRLLTILVNYMRRAYRVGS